MCGLRVIGFLHSFRLQKLRLAHVWFISYLHPPVRTRVVLASWQIWRVSDLFPAHVHLLQLWQYVQVNLVERAGHYAFLDQPQEFLEKLLSQTLTAFPDWEARLQRKPDEATG